MSEPTLSSLEADILYVIWLKQVWEKSEIRAALTYAEIIRNVRSDEGGKHRQGDDSIEKAVRKLVARKLLEVTESQPEQHQDPETGNALPGPMPLAFKIETRSVLTWPTTARLAMIVFSEDIPKNNLFDRMLSEKLIFHKSGDSFRMADAEEALAFAAGKIEEAMEPYIQILPSASAEVLKATKRTTRERPFLKKIADPKHTRTAPAVA